MAEESNGCVLFFTAQWKLKHVQAIRMLFKSSVCDFLQLVLFLRYRLIMAIQPWPHPCPARRPRKTEQWRPTKRTKRQQQKLHWLGVIVLFRIAETVILSWDIIW